MVEVVVGKDYFIFVIVICLCKQICPPRPVPGISHYSYFARSWKKCTSTSFFEIMEIVCSKIFKMSISKQDVCINGNLGNGYAKVNTDL